MISALRWVELVVERGWDSFAGVPCSYLTPLIDHVIAREDLGYLPLTNEGEAVALGCGRALAGGWPVVMFQNSGLGNAVNPLTSLARLFGVPLLMVVTWRGRPGEKDAPQHALMGARTRELLEAMEIPHEVAAAEEADLSVQLARLSKLAVRTPGPAALVLPKGTVARSGEPVPGPELSAPDGELSEAEAGETTLGRTEALEAFLEVAGEGWPVLASTGKISRELFRLRDGENHFYMVGSMGCVASLALGVSLQWEGSAPVVALDGDGAALMRLEAMAGVGAHAPENLIHVILDNGVHDTTGGQATLSPGVDLPRVANACGYARARSVRSRDAFADALREAASGGGPALVHLRIRPGSPPELPRPGEQPTFYARRFHDYLEGAAR